MEVELWEPVLAIRDISSVMLRLNEEDLLSRMWYWRERNSKLEGFSQCFWLVKLGIEEAADEIDSVTAVRSTSECDKQKEEGQRMLILLSLLYSEPGANLVIPMM